MLDAGAQAVISSQVSVSKRNALVELNWKFKRYYTPYESNGKSILGSVDIYCYQGELL